MDRGLLRSIRTARAVTGLGLLATLGACSLGPGRGCTAVGGTSYVAVSVDPGIRTGVASLRLELCQADHCGRTTFSTTPPDEGGTYIQQGVALNGDAYMVDLSGLGKGWKPAATSRLEVSGVSARGTTTVHQTESFVFHQSYPNGRECDAAPYLSHHTRIGTQDRIR